MTAPNFNQQSPAAVADLNPLDQRLAADSSAAAVWAKAKASFGTLASAFGTLSALSDGMFQQIVTIEANTRLTSQARAQDKAQVRNATQQQIEELRRTCEAAYQQACQVVDANLDPPGYKPVNGVMGTDATASLLAFERVKAGWEKARMVLDAVGDDARVRDRLFALAHDASVRNDLDMVAALRDYGAYYLAARGQELPRAAFVAQLNQSIGAAASPAVRAASQMQSVLQAGWLSLQAAFTVALNNARGTGVGRVQGLAGWPGQPPVSL